MTKPYLGQELLATQPDYDIEGEIAKDSDGKVKMIPPYRPSNDLKKALAYARLLNRPLLLRGEPGSGKTRLAQAIAYELYGKEYKRHFFEWYVKSTSKATEGLYIFDHLARLRDVEMKIEQPKENYVAYGPLGNAFKINKKDDAFDFEVQAILLIDEVDKADIDFPNDLLLELDQKRFMVKELSEKDKPPYEIVAQNEPIIIITSNDERELPNAFLRRCVFHYITAGEKEDRIEMVKAHLEMQKNDAFNSVIEKAVERFMKLVKAMKDNSNKVPDNSELIDWIKVIHHYWKDNKKEIEYLLGEDKQLYLSEILLKDKDDSDKFGKKQ